MALSDDQKAMLRLLAQREQGYDDIAALMGLNVDEVRARVKDALAELDREKAEGKLDGEQAVGSAEAKDEVEPPPFREPAPEAPAAEPAAKTKPPVKAEPKPPSAKKAAKVPRPGLPKDQGALRGLIAGAAVVLVIVILLVTGVFGDGGGGSESTTATGETAGESSSGGAEGAPTSGGKQPTQAVLKPVGGGSASGQALFGRSGRQVVLLLAARGLDPSPPGSSYTLSLVRSPSQRLPLIATKVGAAGVISGRFRVAPQVLGLLAAGFDEMEISLVPNDELKVALSQAKHSRKAPAYGGEAVLTGKVTGPIVEAGGEG